MEYITISAITIICYLIGEIFKVIIKKNTRLYRIIPIVVGLIGGVFGVFIHNISPEVFRFENWLIALITGIISGLASTGSHQIIKQFIKIKEDN